MPSSLHRHTDDCWGEPHLAQVYGDQWIRIRRCKYGGGYIEVPR